jgi:tetratricopeptide (TPR) repeat protein
MDANVRHLMTQLRQNPLDFTVLDELRQHCESTGSYAVWAEALEHHARAASAADVDPAELGRLHYELGNLYRDQLGQNDRALAHYRAAVDFDAAQRPAITAARAIAAEAGAWSDAADLLAQEAESLPAGPRRAAAYVELAELQRERLGAREDAINSLVEAIQTAPDDLQARHQLATMLLDDADRAADAGDAAAKRETAADLLAGMAREVDDDYALAYLEAALDATPDHEPSLSLLETVAARKQRGDLLARRWLAAIPAAREARLARELRLKMARAYIAVGQLPDARICLEPLLSQGDPEAIVLAKQSMRPAAPGSEPWRSEPSRAEPAPVEAAPSFGGGGLAEELAALGSLAADDAHAPLADLASLERNEGSRERGGEGSSLPNEGAGRGADDTSGRAASQPPEGSRFDSEPPSRRTDNEPTNAAYRPPSFDDDPDPFAEQTQPRAQPLTLAELNALTGEDHEPGFARHHPTGSDGEATRVSPAGDETAVSELASLRAELAKRLRFRDRRGAAEVAEVLLSRGVFDGEAIHAMEEHYRLSRDFDKLRDLCEMLADEQSFGKDSRVGRLREAVLLSESKLGDQDGALRNLRALLALEPDDAQAFGKLRTTLRRAQNWSELAELLGARAKAPGSAQARAELYRDLGALQREKRNDPEQALRAYAVAAELDPGNLDDAVVLSGLYAEAGRYAEAAAMYERRVEHAQPHEQPALLATLAQIYEDKLHQDERAQDVLERWRALAPNKPEPLVALVRVLERRGEFRGLVDALTSQLEQVPAAQRGALHARIAQVAFDKLGDAQRAADSYGEAIVRSPQDVVLWQRATLAYEQAGRSLELDELLWGIANSSRDRANASVVFDHLAITREARGDLAGAISAREAQYAITQDDAPLSALVALLRTADRPAELSRRLDELARRSLGEEARALRFERASLLADQLHDPEAAKAELERILSDLNTDDATALRKLIDLCKVTGDVARRASAQERLVKLAPSLAARVELAIELIDVYEQELVDLPGAVRVLHAWTSLEPDNPTPYMRLLPLLAQTGKKRELIGALDRLGALAITDQEAGEFTLRAARVAMELEDWDGAWNRLVPRVVERDDEAAERMLRELTKQAQRGEQLSALYVGLAQRAQTAEDEQKRWSDAARVFEHELGAHDRALEATLRALAKQLDSRELLSEVERLTAKANAWPRLGQVYDSMVRKADRTDTRIELLMRHAHLLEQEAKDAPAAFERVWLAFQLDPTNDHTYGEAKRLAIATGRREELLGSYERRTQSNASREARLEALLDACALAQHELEDTARATGYLSRAVALAGDTSELLVVIEDRLRALDAAQPPVSGRGLVAELTGVYEALAPEYPRAPQLPATWLARAAKIHEQDLHDPVAAFRALERACALTPGDEALLEELSRVAARSESWEALAKHLQHAADVAIDSNSSSAALRRLGLLCERELGSPSRAADAYEQLVRLRPQDGDASRRLRQCLKQAERHDELLIAIDRELLVLEPEEKRELLKEAAETWEFGLKNRYEAVDAWKKVATLAPADPDALAALARLRVRPRTDDSLLEEEVVVLPEDLRPSQVAAQVTLSASSLFSTSNVQEAPRSNGFMTGRESAVEPERVTHDDLASLGVEAGTSAPLPQEILVHAAVGRDFDADVTTPLDTAVPADLTIPLDPEPDDAPAPGDADLTMELHDADATTVLEERGSDDAPGPAQEPSPAEAPAEVEELLAEGAPIAAAAAEPAALAAPQEDLANEVDDDAQTGAGPASAEIAVADRAAAAHDASLLEEEEDDDGEHEEIDAEELVEDDDDQALAEPPPPDEQSGLSSLVDSRGSATPPPLPTRREHSED